MREGRTRRRGMIGSGSVVAGLRVFSDPRRWIGPAVVVCVLAIAPVAAALAAADSGVMINGAAASPSGSSNEYCAGPTMCVTLIDTSKDPNTEQVSIESQTPGSPVTGVQAKIPIANWSGVSNNGPCILLSGHFLGCVLDHALMMNTLID